MRKVSVAKAEAHLSDCIEDAERGKPVVITRHSKSVAALISMDDFEQIQKVRRAGPKEGLAGLAGGWKNSDELVSILQTSKRTASRNIPDLD